MMTGAQILVQSLIAQGVDTIFGYPGAAVLSLYDELYQQRDRIRHILVSHEQHAAHAADGYARSTGRIGICLATSGPGATNLVTGIATAFMDSSPVVAITGNVAMNLLGKDSFQEVDITGITIPIVKHSWIVNDAAVLAGIVQEAFVVAKARRPGPVLIDIPTNVLEQCIMSVPVPSARLWRLAAPPETDTAAFDSFDSFHYAAWVLQSARRPVIYAGGGIIRANAAAELLHLAERLNAPVTLSLMGVAAFPSRHRLCAGLIGMYGTERSAEAIRRADVVLALGARFSERVTGSIPLSPDVKILHFDIDPAEINKNRRATVAVIGDLKLTVPRLCAQLPPGYAEQRAVPITSAPCSALSPRFIIEQTACRLGDRAIVATDVGQHQLWTAQFYPFTGTQLFLTSGGLGTMGFGLGAAIGAALANADRPVVLFTGDGSFRMNCGELATVTAYRLPILIVIFNNRQLGMVKQWQDIRYAGRHSETLLDRPPDFVALAAAYGVSGVRVSDAVSFVSALDIAVAEKKAWIIEVILDGSETV